MRIKLFVFLLFCLFCAGLKAQEFELPDINPDSKEFCDRTEKYMIDAAVWLEQTPIGKQTEKRKIINAWVLAWLTHSASVTIVLHKFVTEIFDKNPDLLFVYMAGYARYCLENHTKDALPAHVAGIKSAIHCYTSGGEIKRNKALEKVIQKDKEGKLAEWVADEIKIQNKN
ncbi:MAG: hypothetical protein N2747_10770 [Chitinophagaceae bacterium]|nr:hypothetical protein [Chitinophagaceae bacterium]